MNISVTFHRYLGEKRGAHNFLRKRPEPVSMNSINKINPFATFMNHRKHESKIYREAIGGVEKSFPRLQGILCM